eukprot:COSAG04_NODE_16354_length_502_cov_0.645161_2_plen_54_part_01
MSAVDRLPIWNLDGCPFFQKVQLLIIGCVWTGLFQEQRAAGRNLPAAEAFASFR